MFTGAPRHRMLGFMLALKGVVADWVVNQGPAVHIERVSALFRAGATIVGIRSGQADSSGRQVLPALRAALAG